jgi:hypothetical protein
LTRISWRWFLALYALVLCSVAPLRPLWLDEVLQLSDTYHNTLFETVDRVAHNPGGVPLPYIVQNIFVNIVDLPFYCARLLAVLWAVGAMAALIWLTRLLQPAGDWLLAAVSYAVLPISVRYAVEIRQYGPALAFGICSTALLVWLDQKPTRRRAVLYGCALTFGIYSHPYLGFVAMAHAIWALRRPAVKYILISFAASVLAFLPWYLFARGYWIKAVVQGGYHAAFTWKTPLMIPHELSGGGYLLTCAWLALAFYGYRQTKMSDASKHLLILCILVPLPLVMFANILFRYFFAIRQLVFLVPPLCILAAEGLRALSTVPRAAVSLALLLIALFYDFRWVHQMFLLLLVP